MYLSRITLYTSQFSPEQLLQLIERGEYVMHQWLWQLFPAMEARQFLYRREELQGALRFFVLSAQPPVASEIAEVQCRPFDPALSVGQQLCFSLRANPTICKAGKRHDLLMDAKRQVKAHVDKRDIWPYQQKAALTWLAQQGERHGFTPTEVSIDAYRQQQIRSQKSRRSIQFSSVDYNGTLVVNQPALFLQSLASGYGKSRAFGCGLMMIKSWNGA
ncbi:type I-E CRISPR-associated protein Cas6/Cse3/CasE [Enterobacteriaceae bacterium ESL0689]|nr:type I-E CRISPR-associated protein Cas6/Cse3/CasE [Enterobacteriaceae bacterium ESL0689]